MDPQLIPFNRPALVGREMDYIADAMASHHASAGGKYTLLSSRLLASELGAADVLLTTSCTDALELAALLLGIGPGDSNVYLPPADAWWLAIASAM